MSALSDKEQIRYSRHLLIKEVGLAGQKKLKSTHIVVVGAGGLGSPALFYLAAAGIGTLTLIDDDKVELSNLQRQILYKVNHMGQAKAQAAAKVISSLNNQIKVNPLCQKLDETNCSELLKGADIILDCSDNFTTRYLVNRYCLARSIPLVSAAAIATQGQVMSFDFRDENSPCYGCVFPQTDEQTALNCDNAGVLSPLLGVIGSMQSLLAINILLGHKAGSEFIQFDGLTLQQQRFSIQKDSECSECNNSVWTRC